MGKPFLLLQRNSQWEWCSASFSLYFSAVPTKWKYQQLVIMSPLHRHRLISLRKLRSRLREAVNFFAMAMIRYVYSFRYSWFEVFSASDSPSEILDLNRLVLFSLRCLAMKSAECLLRYSSSRQVVVSVRLIYQCKAKAKLIWHTSITISQLVPTSLQNLEWILALTRFTVLH